MDGLKVSRELFQSIVEAVFCERSDAAPAAALQQHADDWCRKYGIPPVDTSAPASIVIETWDADKARKALAAMREVEPRIITGDLPRRLGGMAILFDFGGGRVGLADGKRRMNLLTRNGGTLSVVVLRFAR